MKPDEALLVHLALTVTLAEASAVEAWLAAAGLRAQWIADEEELNGRLPELQFLLLGRSPRLDWTRAAKLELLQVAGSGVDPLLPAVGLSERTRIANCRGVSAEAVRDHVLGLLLSHARALPRYAAQQREGLWLRGAHASVAGKRLTLVGFGAVGKTVSAAVQALGLEVRAVSRSGQTCEGAARVFAAERLLEALHGADFVVVCVPLTRQTRGFIDRAALARLSPDTLLIDVSRGGVVDVVALEAALRAGRLGAAALDVFESEPLPSSHSLWSCPNLTITPHVAGLLPDYLERVVELFVDNVRLVRAGEEPRTLVSRELEY